MSTAGTGSGHEPVHVSPVAVLEDLQDELGPLLDKPVPPPGLLALHADLEGNRVQQPTASEPHVGQPEGTVDHHAEQQVVECTRRALGAEADPGQHRLYPGDPQCLERRGEEEILFEAVAATPSGDQLLLQPVGIELHRSPARRVEVLEGDRRGMGPVDLGQRRPPGR